MSIKMTERPRIQAQIAGIMSEKITHAGEKSIKFESYSHQNNIIAMLATYDKLPSFSINFLSNFHAIG
jgi:hypothetical protein